LTIQEKSDGTFFSDSQKNVNINKPDIVMPGGDVIRQCIGSAYCKVLVWLAMILLQDSGTSLATPLATNLAAKLLNL
jgi:hypothetical protein